MQRLASRIVATATLILAMTGVPASAEVTAVDREVIARILALRGEAVRLEMGLTPEARAELERLLREAEQKRRTVAEPSPTAATPADDIPPRVDQEPNPVASVPVHEDEQVETDSSPPLPTQPATDPSTTRGRCKAAFAVLDTNQDGFINATDRYWRYLYLWRDHDQDGRMTDKEVENPFDLEISGLRVDLRFFIKKNGTFGDVHTGEYIEFERVSSRGTSRGNLVVEASRIKRSDGPQILDASGNVLEGFQVLRAGMTMFVDGEKLLFHCP